MPNDYTLDLDDTPARFMRTVLYEAFALGWTHKELAARAGVSKYQLSRWLNGHVEPSMGSRYKLWRAITDAD